MSDRNNFFDIFSYIKSKLEKEKVTEDKVIVGMNVDSNDEPYIEITYIDTYGTRAGLNDNFENLGEIAGYANYYSEIFDTFTNDAVISIVYDTGTEKLNLLKTRNGDYIGNKFLEDFENAVFVGYLVKGLNFCFKRKVEILYEVMKNIMRASYEVDLETDVIFMVQDQILSNIYTNRSFKNGYTENENIENTNEGNLSIIESVYNDKLGNNSIQKIKK